MSETSDTIFRIAHLSDMHLGPLPRVSALDLIGKRITGYANWHRKRALIHAMETLGRIVDDIHAQAPDHIACTGDIANIGLKAEFEVGRGFLEQLGPGDRVSFVPGNHDAYVRSSLPLLEKILGPWMTGDGENRPTFPYVKRRGRVALIGLNSGIPTAPFLATGKLGRKQIARAEELLTALGRDNLCRVIMIHHPPHHRGAQPGRELIDAKTFEAMLARTGAELVLYGHNHRTTITHRPGARGPIPIVGVSSASVIAGLPGHRASWHLVTITPNAAGGFHVTIGKRGIDEEGHIIDFGPLPLPI